MTMIVNLVIRRLQYYYGYLIGYLLTRVAMKVLRLA